MFKTHRLQLFIVAAFVCTLLCIGLLAHQLAEMKIESKSKTEVLQKKIDEYQNEIRAYSKANSLQQFSPSNSRDNSQEIGETSSQNSENIFLSKKIGGHTYTIISDKSDRNDPAYFYSLHIREDGETLPSEVVSFGQQATRVINPNTADFWIDFQGGRVFTLQVLFQPDGQLNYAITGVFETDLNKIEDLTDDKVKLLTTFSDSFLSTSSLLLFDPAHATLLIEQGGGDGCGGGGTIYTVSLSGQKSEVISHAYGCVTAGKNPPIWGGMIGQQLVLADTNIEQVDGDQIIHLKNIYLLNPFTRERNTIVSDPDILSNTELMYRNSDNMSQQLSDDEILVEKKTADNSDLGLYALNYLTKELRKITEVLPLDDASEGVSH